MQAIEGAQVLRPEPGSSLRQSTRPRTLSLGALGVVCAALAACGGGAGGGGQPTGAAASGDASTLLAQPHFHLAPLVLAPPAATEAGVSSAAGEVAPRQVALTNDLAGLPTRGLVITRIPSTPYSGPQSGAQPSSAGATATVVIYSPAQIRAAYRLPALPDPDLPLGTQDAAALGAGQTIYVVGAHASPTLYADLTQFDRSFGLPGCALLPLPAATALPLAPATPSVGCTLSIAYVDGTGARTDAAPAYDEAWAIELTMDVEWAHATAPMARLVVLAAPSGDVGLLAAAVRLANAMGPGVVSMSFGAPEAAYARAFEDVFAGHAAMSYVASAGDSGGGVAWPSSAPEVLAVGGTTLQFAGGAARQESAWRHTGGGWSSYFEAPPWQAALQPAPPPPPKNARHHPDKRRVTRSVADVAFNADPYSGQFIAVTAPGATQSGWYGGGGTSIGAPQWAGLIAVANAQRALAGRAPLGTLQPVLYQRIAAVAGLYAGALYDVRSGSDTSFAAHVGYDLPTGLGTPNAANLLAQLNAP